MIDRPTDQPSRGAWLAVALAVIALGALGAGIMVGARGGLGDETQPAADPVAPGATVDLSQLSFPPPTPLAPPDTAGISSGIVEPGRASLGEPAPDFTLDTPDGGTIKLSDFAGQPVILNFWATWCRPCQVEMPYLESAHTAHADKGLVVLGVNVAEQSSVVQPFLDQHSLTFPVALDLNSQVADLYRVFSYPTTYLIDRNGRVINIRRGVYANQFDVNQSVSLILPEAKEN